MLALVHLSGKPGQVDVQIPILKVKQAWLCNAVEQNQEALTTSMHGLTFPVQPFQIVTVRVEGTSTVH